jgi:hypothetical protein
MQSEASTSKAKAVVPRRRNKAPEKTPVFDPNAWVDIANLPWYTSCLVEKSGEEIIAQLPHEFKVSKQTRPSNDFNIPQNPQKAAHKGFTTISDTYKKKESRSFIETLRNDVRFCNKHKPATHTLFFYTLIDRILSMNEACTPPQQLERTRYLINPSQITNVVSATLVQGHKQYAHSPSLASTHFTIGCPNSKHCAPT